ncbi:MAG: carboxylating nicotinate-nucleotide diphosphorylase [Deltaproteobacteria bacterium]|nr:carboxylating nicotinate-nucleotide diphosphorylase [Deltaproteobacteria bacterium]
MKRANLNWNQVDLIIEHALEEDIGARDLTTELLFPKDGKCDAIIQAKEEGIIAGLPIAKRVFRKLKKDIEWVENKRDGESVSKGDILVNIHGSKTAILTGERVALNFIQRLSGIATLTSKFVKAVEGLPVKITDTRKTAPCLRILDKYAVRTGGGHNYRLGLFDGVLIKDNHLKLIGGITEAVKAIKKRPGFRFQIEVETSTLEEVREAIAAGVDIIMLDNMTLKMMRRAVDMIKGRALTEASGGITLRNVRRVAETRVNIISIGSLTHSPEALDIGLYLV